jgi:uncharacterized YccA/Bax inhibitor family protein
MVKQIQPEKAKWKATLCLSVLTKWHYIGIDPGILATADVFS